MASFLEDITPFYGTGIWRIQQDGNCRKRPESADFRWNSLPVMEIIREIREQGLLQVRIFLS